MYLNSSRWVVVTSTEYLNCVWPTEHTLEGGRRGRRSGGGKGEQGGCGREELSSDHFAMGSLSATKLEGCILYMFICSTCQRGCRGYTADWETGNPSCSGNHMEYLGVVA